jgi:hypothetical protein
MDLHRWMMKPWVCEDKDRDEAQWRRQYRRGGGLSPSYLGKSHGALRHFLSK